jgi:hypothetical protein
MQISKHNTVHKQNQGQKPYDHFNRYRKGFWQIQHPFMINAPKKLGIEGMFLKIRKVICET